MTSTYHAVRGLAALALAGGVLAACGGSDDDDKGDSAATTATTPAAAPVSGSLSIIGVWSGDEQRSFQAVLDGFKAKNPDVSVKYTSAGDNLPTVLGTAVEGGRPPDVAAVAQPALISDFVKRGKAKSIDFAQSTIAGNFPADIVKLGQSGGKLYSFVFKAANKSTVWYNVPAFEAAGVKAPATWDEFKTNAATLKASGTKAYSLGGADGWTLTDLFENVYLRQAGPEKYDQLTTHDIKWTDQSVKDALTTMADIFKDTDNIVGGTSGALQTEFPTSVSNVFSKSPKAAQVIEGDFVPGVVAEKKALTAVTGYNVFSFPSIDGSEPAVVGGGDSIAMFKDTPASRALVTYLASPEAATIWAKRGGFSSANTKLDAAAYPDDITRTTATAIAKTATFRFDMSDLAPAAFGGTPGQGEWKILQDFLRDPSDISGTASKLETSAAKAYKADKS